MLASVSAWMLPHSCSPPRLHSPPPARAPIPPRPSAAPPTECGTHRWRASSSPSCPLRTTSTRRARSPCRTPAAAPLHAYAANGSYTVVLTAINGNCTSTETYTINIAVALNELVGIEGLNIYPNPAKDLLNIDFTNTTDQNLELQIVDQFGRVILTNNDNNLGVMHQEISLANFLSGVYYLRLNSNSSTRIEKIVITK